MRAPPRLAIAALMLLFMACATFLGTRSQRKSIKAPHAIHVEGDVDCLACHEDIFEATSLAQRSLPPEKKCLECHKEAHSEGNCQMCHIGEPTTYLPVERHLIFNHEAHLELEEIDEDCGKCHLRLPEPGLTASTTPPKATCNQCHVHQAQFDQGRCELCHISLDRYPLEPITAFSHQGDYLRRHGLDARAGQACVTCHQQSFCADCHATPGTVPLGIDLLLAERVDRQFIHRNDFQNRHSVEARADGTMCLKCHDTPSCESCHALRGLASGSDPLRNPHPQGYGMGMEHGLDARGDITSCAACHDQGAQSVCVECHTVGGVGGNPHPLSWSRPDSRKEINGNATCLVCHH